MLSPSFIVSSDTQRISSLLQLNLLPSECRGITRAVLDFDYVPPLVVVFSARSRMPPCCEPTAHVKSFATVDEFMQYMSGVAF